MNFLYIYKDKKRYKVTCTPLLWCVHKYVYSNLLRKISTFMQSFDKEKWFQKGLILLGIKSFDRHQKGGG